jgi:hypothetical protein
MKIPSWVKSSVITVGDGRGFVVSDSQANQLVITAAHCLPHFPPCHAMSDQSERTYQKLLAPLGEEPSVWAECMFADPIADIAVLGSPDNQELFDQADAYPLLACAGGCRNDDQACGQVAVKVQTVCEPIKQETLACSGTKGSCVGGRRLG